ncbi:MAG: VanZ family protein [bacterium]|nr:VanZ family protein [bacterium]
MEDGDQAPPPSQQQETSPLRTWGPAACVAAVILILSSIPGTAFPKHPDRLNSAVHFLEFCLLGFFLTRAISTWRPMGRLSLILTSAAICGTFGFLDEAHQFLIPYRMFDIMDLFYDILGAITGGLIFIVTGCSSAHADGA